MKRYGEAVDTAAVLLLRVGDRKVRWNIKNIKKKERRNERKKKRRTGIGLSSKTNC